jgi:hypothetical protein
MWHAKESGDVYRVLMGTCEDLGVDLKMIVNWVLKQWNGREWIYLVQDRGKWGAGVNKV